MKIIEFVKNEASMHKDRAAYMIVCLLCVAVYARTLDVPFYFDDYSYIVNNPFIRTLWGVFDKDLILHATVDYSDVKTSVLTRPLPYVTFAMNYALQQTDVAGYHLGNLLIHLTNALLMYTLIILMWRHHAAQQSAGFLAESSGITVRWVAFFTAALFVVHPVMINSVTWIFQRSVLLASCFYLLTLIMYVRWHLSHRNSLLTNIAFYLIALISCFASMRCKEFSITLPLMLVLYDVVFCTGTLRQRSLRLLPFLLMLSVIPITRLSLDNVEITRASGEMPSTLHVVSYMVKSPLQYFTTQFSTNINQTSIVSMSPLEYLYTQFRVVVTYQRMLLIPVGLNFLHDYPFYRTLAEPAVYCSIIFHVLLISLACYMLWISRTCEPENVFRFRMASFGLLWFYLALAVECSILPIDDHFHEYRIYLPAFGFIAAILSMIQLVVRNFILWKFAMAFTSILLVLVIVAFSTLTILRNEQWRDPLVFWQDALTKSPNKVRIHGYIGSVYRLRGDMANALREYRIMLSNDFRYGQDHFGLGEELLENGFYREAVEEYLVALKIRPDKTFVYSRLAEAYHNLGEDLLAGEAMQKATAKSKYVGVGEGVW